VYSIARFELKAQGSGTRLVFDHTGSRPSEGASREGWEEHYWATLRRFFKCDGRYSSFLQIAASAESIASLVSTAHGLAQWWAEEVTEVDGCAELSFFNRSTVYRLRHRPAIRPGSSSGCVKRVAV